MLRFNEICIPDQKKKKKGIWLDNELKPPIETWNSALQ